MTRSFCLVLTNSIAKKVQMVNLSWSWSDVKSVNTPIHMNTIQIIMIAVAHMDITDIMHTMIHHKW